MFIEIVDMLTKRNSGLNVLVVIRNKKIWANQCFEGYDTFLIQVQQYITQSTFECELKRSFCIMLHSQNNYQPLPV